jgi:hypothetical protein
MFGTAKSTGAVLLEAMFPYPVKKFAASFRPDI